MSDSINTFRTLLQIDVSHYVEKKGQFAYLSWPYAVSQLRLADPAAHWEVRRFDGLPYLSTELGFFVEVAVTVGGVTLSQIHPVLDGRNKPMLAPTPFDINTSIQRCLVKAIALHGLGLSIYAGEDLPVLTEGEEPPKPPETTSKVSPLPTKKPERKSVEWLTDAQLRFVKKLIQETDTNPDELLAYFGFETLDTIPKAEATRVIRALESKRRAA
jgi:hypothetical protein